MADLAGKRFEGPDEVREFTDGKGRVELVDLNGHAVGPGTFEPGWRWSEHVKPIAGTDSCQVEHIGYVLEGRMALRMDDGTEREFGPGGIFHMSPGHDARIVGDEACVLLDFGGRKDTPKRAAAVRPTGDLVETPSVRPGRQRHARHSVGIEGARRRASCSWCRIATASQLPTSRNSRLSRQDAAPAISGP